MLAYGTIIFMKKIFCVGLSLIICAACASVFSACGGSAEVEYSLSDDGSYYIVSGVSGNKSALKTYSVLSAYPDENGHLLPVKEVGYEAFMNCTSLYSVTLPEGIEKIGERAFMRCSFSSIILPQTLTEIAYGAFGMCDNLTEVTIPESVTTLAPRSFAYCSGLKVVYVKANITDLAYGTFVNSVVSTGSNYYYDTSLTEVYLSSTITKINYTALSGNAITDIYYEGSSESWDELYFYTYDTDDDGQTVETKMEKSEVIGAVKVHTDYKF
jgi:hypothetical protein